MTRADPDHSTSHREPSADDDHRFPHPLLFLIPVVVISLIALAINRVEPDHPGPFYDVAMLPTGPPGTIVRSQAIKGLPAGRQGWTVLYLSTGLDGRPIAVSGTVFAPTGDPPAAGRPVVAWAHPTTGVASRCAPSLETDGGAAKIPGLDQLLQAGDVVTATDYPGLGTPGPHPYLVGESEGRAVLDSVRAAHDLPTGAGSTFAVWGHSQGGHAALFSGQIAPTYAPELRLVGIAAAAPATELSALLQHDVDGLAGTVLLSMAVVSWSQVYADKGLTMGQVLLPTAFPTARLIGDDCIETEGQVLVDLPEAAIEKHDFLSDTPPWEDPSWDALLTANTPGAAPIAVPVLVDQGTADTVVWPGITAEWVRAQCAAGVKIDEQTYNGVTHTDIATTSAGDAVAWLGARFAGDTATSTCPTPALATPPT